MSYVNWERHFVRTSACACMCCTCAHVSLCTCLCMHVCLCVHVHTRVCVRACACMCVCAYMCTRESVCVLVCVCPQVASLYDCTSLQHTVDPAHHPRPLQGDAAGVPHVPCRQCHQKQRGPVESRFTRGGTDYSCAHTNGEIN